MLTNVLFYNDANLYHRDAEYYKNRVLVEHIMLSTLLSMNIDVGKKHRLNIHLDSNASEIMNKYRIIGSLDVCFPFNEQEYYASKYRHKYFLGVLCQVFSFLLAEYGNKEIGYIIHEIKKMESSENLVLKEYVTKPKSSPSRKMKAVVFCIHDSSQLTLYLDILDKGMNLIKRVKFFEDNSSPKFGMSRFLKIRWKSSQLITIRDNYEYSGNQEWLINIDS